MSNNKDRWSQRWPSHIAEKFVPTSDWTQDSQGNYILDIDLPGFKHEEVRIEPASTDHIKIEGESIVNETKCIYIDQTFRIPENSDIQNIMGKFVGQHLYITIPKMIAENSTPDQSSQEEDNHEVEEDYKEDHTNPERENQTCRVSSSPEKITKKTKGKDGPVAIAINCAKRNKGIVLSIVVSFSLGVWVSKHWI